MWLPHVVTSPPALEPVAMTELKASVEVEVDDTSHDTLLGVNLGAARRAAEDRTGAKFITQSVLLQGSAFCDLARLPVAPIASVTSLTYLDTDGVEQTVDPATYDLVSAGTRALVRLKPGNSWPATACAPDAVRLTVEAGYGATAADVPDPIRQAIMLIAADWFAHREDSAVEDRRPVPNGAKALLAAYFVH